MKEVENVKSLRFNGGYYVIFSVGKKCEEDRRGTEAQCLLLNATVCEFNP